MLKKNIETFAKKCAVSRRIRLKAGIIIDLLEQISIGLSSVKHEELIDFIRLKTLYPDSIPHQEQILSSLKKMLTILSCVFSGSLFLKKT